MQDEIVIQGKRYLLVPLDEEADSILDEYQISRPDQTGERNVGAEVNQTTEIKDAIPKVSEYRERYKQRKVKPSEISVAPKLLDIEDKSEGITDGYEYKGEKLFFGEGLEQDTY